MLRQLLGKLLARLHVRGRDLAIFLVSLLTAFVFWLGYNLSQDYSEIVTVPVVAESNLEGRASVSETQSNVVARCRMPGYRIFRLGRLARREPVRVYFAPEDFVYLQEDTYSIPSSALGSYVKEIFGDEAILESFVSHSLQFRFARENFRKVPVIPVQVIEYRSQYMPLGRLQVFPDSVVVYGEPRIIENVERVMTEAIEARGVHAPLNGVVPLETPSGVRLSEHEVNYSQEVTRYVELRSTVKVRALNVPAGRELQIYPSTAEVVYRCAFPMGSDPTEGIYFYVDYNEFARSLSGRCVAHPSAEPLSIIDYTIEPQVFECVEN
ncbi:MAG: hypothetical protein J6Y27_06280 [Bacteroidales bacterium]|nr:hypothetical protein [Bacteroidales bacterium]MBP5389934.1 hypothetical protein [Bacteroidales bacterium]MBP5635711.1 hypothetical protein [Bacteroidales bacterium]MCR5571869.1 hypothetical protein [Bacteroidales bacterium]